MSRRGGPNSWRNQPRDPSRPINLIVRQPYFGMIARGEKTIEGRVEYPFLRRAHEGLPLHFRRGQQERPVIQCGIDWVLRAPDFEQALLDVEWQKAVPNARHFDEALAVYDRIYPPEKIQEMGGVILLGFTKQGIVHG